MDTIKKFLMLCSESPTGLRWALKPSPRMHVGDVAGSKGSGGYFRLGLMGKQYRAHRVVALLLGILTEEEFDDSNVLVDHRDGDITNNKPSNLRKSTHKQNQMNRKAHREGSPVNIRRLPSGNFNARCQVRGSRHVIGTASSIAELQELMLSFYKEKIEDDALDASEKEEYAGLFLLLNEEVNNGHI